MKKRRLGVTPLTLIGVALLWLCVLLSTGCTSQDELKAPSEGECKVVILLHASGSSSMDQTSPKSLSTRADGGMDENIVKNITLHVLKDEYQSQPLVSRYLGREGENYLYEATLNVDADYVNYDSASGKYFLSARLAAVANTPLYPETRPLGAEPINLKKIAEIGAIPMWGVTTIENLELRVGDRINIGKKIELLRSVAKFTFQLDSSLVDTYIISDISPSANNYSNLTILEPGGAPFALSTSSMRQEDWFNPSAVGEKEGLELIEGLGTDKVTVYTAERIILPTLEPEYFNISLSRLDDTGGEVRGKIYLCDYDSSVADFASSFTKLVRNHDYQYHISLADLKMLISFREWIYGGKVHIELE